MLRYNKMRFGLREIMNYFINNKLEKFLQVIVEIFLKNIFYYKRDYVIYGWNFLENQCIKNLSVGKTAST